MAPNQQAIDSAIQFLSDPQVATQPLSQKLSFLESKGLSPAEIQQILALTNNDSIQQPHIHQQLPPMPPPRALPASYDWKDYLIMSTTTLGFLFGAYHVVSNHILPSILPPSKTKLDEDKEAMDREFERVESILNKLETDQREFIDNQNEKSKAIDDTLIQLSSLINDTTERNLRNDETLKYLKLEIESIKTTLLKNLESQKDTISNELQSLSKVTRNIKEDLQQQGNKTNNQISNETIVPSISPPSNLLTNKSYDSAISDSNSTQNSNASSRFNLNIPPPSSVPTAKDILKDEYTKPKPKPQEAGIPAWQLAAESGK